MARKRLRGTLVDYLVSAIEPVLIMLMVGGLMFFLLDLWYHGPFLERLQWIVFWFVLGIVLITRVSMMIGTSLAMGYGVTLGGAVVPWPRGLPVSGRSSWLSSASFGGSRTS